MSVDDICDFRDKKRDLSARAPKRDGISRESKWEKQEAAKKKEMIASSKRRKVKQDGGQVNCQLDQLFT